MQIHLSLFKNNQGSTSFICSLTTTSTSTTTDPTTDTYTTTMYTTSDATTTTTTTKDTTTDTTGDLTTTMNAPTTQTTCKYNWWFISLYETFILSFCQSYCCKILFFNLKPIITWQISHWLHHLPMWTIYLHLHWNKS